jgi:predicted enzyme related to lactoylglutathione lyase
LIKDAGGSVRGTSYTIPTVGELMHFTDTEGNQAIIIQYETEARKELGL